MNSIGIGVVGVAGNHPFSIVSMMLPSPSHHSYDLDGHAHPDFIET